MSIPEKPSDEEIERDLKHVDKVRAENEPVELPRGHRQDKASEKVGDALMLLIGHLDGKFRGVMGIDPIDFFGGGQNVRQVVDHLRAIRNVEGAGTLADEIEREAKGGDWL